MPQTQVWSQSKEQRQETTGRIAANFAAMVFAKDGQINDAEALETAQAIERKAFTVASVEANTTTGQRPAEETQQAYIRKLAALLQEAVQRRASLSLAGGQPAATSNGVQGDAQTVDLSGDREFLEKDAADEAFAPMLAAGAQVTKVKLSTKSFSEEAAQVAARAIQNCADSLQDVDISDVIAGRPEQDALQTLRILCGSLAHMRHLCALDLSDNALGEKGLMACEQVLTSQSGLQRLALQNVGCSIAACRAAARLTEHLSSLTSLRLYNNMSGDEGASAIAEIVARSPQLEELRMASSRVGTEGGTALAQGIAAGSCLLRLDLSDNPLQAEVAPALARALRGQQRLQVLNLNDTGLCDRGVAAIAEAVAAAAPELEQLEFALNELTVVGARALAAALRGKQRLRVLNLRENELGDRGALAVAAALAGLPALETVDLCVNQVRRAGAVGVVKALLDKPSLQLLALDENFIPDDAVEEIQAQFKHAGKQQCLGPLDENDPEGGDEDEEDEEAEHEGADALADALGQTSLNT